MLGAWRAVREQEVARSAAVLTSFNSRLVCSRENPFAGHTVKRQVDDEASLAYTPSPRPPRQRNKQTHTRTSTGTHSERQVDDGTQRQGHHAAVEQDPQHKRPTHPHGWQYVAVHIRTRSRSLSFSLSLTLGQLVSAHGVCASERRIFIACSYSPAHKGAHIEIPIALLGSCSP